MCKPSSSSVNNMDLSLLSSNSLASSSFSDACAMTKPSSSHPTPEECLTILQILGDQCSNTPSERIRKVRFSSKASSTRRYKDTFAARPEHLWYQPDEIVSFKKQARQLVRGSTTNATEEGSSSSCCESMRGLESCTLERQLFRHKTIQCILSAYKKGLKPHEMAKVAKICATWSEEIAFVQACHDYCNVYQPTQKDQIPAVSNTPPEFPFPLRRSSKTKERTTTPSCLGRANKRSVRRRLR